MFEQTRYLQDICTVVLTQTASLLNHLKPLLCYVMLCKRELLNTSARLGVIEYFALHSALIKMLTDSQTVSLYSSVVERWSCKPAVVSSNLTGGNSYFKLIGYTSTMIHQVIEDSGC